MKSLFKIATAKDFKKAHYIFWAAWILLSALLNFTMRETFTIPLFIVRVICTNLTFFYAVYIPLKMSKRVEKVNYFLRIALLLVAVAICYTLYYLYFIYIMPLTKEATESELNIKSITVSFIINFIYFLLFGLMFYFFEDLVQKREEAKAIENKRLEAETAFLRAQINPHFLLNTLNFFYASAFMGKSKELANGILKLSDIMRFALTKNSEALGSLKEEVNFIKSYIELNQMRFNQELVISSRLPGDDEIGASKIVPLVLITLLENVFKHGELLEKEHPVQILLEINKEDNYLKFYTKNKKNFDKSGDGHGIGVKNTMVRLQQAYGDRYTFRVNDTSAFYEATLEIWDAAIS